MSINDYFIHPPAIFVFSGISMLRATNIRFLRSAIWRVVRDTEAQAALPSRLSFPKNLEVETYHGHSVTVHAHQVQKEEATLHYFRE